MGSRDSLGLGVWRGLRPSLSRCDFVLANNAKGFGLEAFFVAAVWVEFGSLTPAKDVSDFDGREGASAKIEESQSQHPALRQRQGTKEKKKKR